MTTADTPTYVGNELELFAEARNWKAYYGRLIAPYLTGDVLEVGAGIGGTTRVLCDGRQRSWTALEPDPKLADAMRRTTAEDPYPVNVRVITGTLATLPADARFDALLYIDVLEHIEDDRAEVARAAERLAPGGALVALSPAHQWLYSPFDARIGHFRRYSASTLAALTPPTLALERLVLLDSVGALASVANRLMLRQDTPTREQIRFWDRWLVPPSRVLDPLFRYRVGKSVVGVWRRTAAAARAQMA